MSQIILARALFVSIALNAFIIVFFWELICEMYNITPNPIKYKVIYTSNPMAICDDNYSWCGTGNNETGYSRMVVPNIIHFIRLDQPVLDFASFVVIQAAIK